MVAPAIRNSGAALVKLFTTAFALAAIGWAIVVTPSFWFEITLAHVAAHIVAGDNYKPEFMEDLDARLDRNRDLTLHSSPLSEGAIIRLRRAEDALRGTDKGAIDARLASLDTSVRETLRESPNNSYQWLVLFWLSNIRNGVNPDHLRYMDMSYRSGKYEGWIAIKRNRLAFANFSALTPSLRESAISEFVHLVRSGMHDVAADILAGPAWQIRNVLLARLAELNDEDRRMFAKALSNRNIDGVSVPGTDTRRDRPWNR